MTKFSKYIGLDTHKDTIAVAIADAGRNKPRYYGEIANTPEAVEKLVKKLCPGGEALSFCYEAGPCGYGIFRQLTHMGHACAVVAPSLIPRKAGDRVKTDRRDSESLARLHRAGELTAVWVPGPEQEAVRDLTRAREDIKALELHHQAPLPERHPRDRSLSRGKGLERSTRCRPERRVAGTG